MARRCPACGRALERGQTVCACGRQTDETPSAGGMLMVLLGGGLVIVGLISIVIGAGVILWKQVSRVATPAGRTPAASVQPDVPPAPAARAMPVTALPPNQVSMANVESPTITPATRPSRVAQSSVVKSPPVSAGEGLLKDLHGPL